MDPNDSAFTWIVIILVIVAIVLGAITIFEYRRRKRKSNSDTRKIGYYEESNDEYFKEDITQLSNEYDNNYTGGGETLMSLNNSRECIDKFNKNGLISDILDKTFEPILYVQDIDKQLTYIPSCSYYTTRHLGQLKSIIGNINFCTLANKSKDDKFTFIYAGSSPNNGGFILNKMFPNMLAISIDPAGHVFHKPNNDNILNERVLYFCCASINKYNLKHRIINIFDGSKIQKLDRDSRIVENISNKWRSYTDIPDTYLDIIKQIIAGDINYNNIIIEDSFTDNTAEFCKKIPDIIFASNIKTNNTDLDICVTNAMMLSWVSIMQPRLSMLRLRLPQYTDSTISKKSCSTYKYYFDKVKHLVDFIADYKKKKFNFILGKEAIQAFAGTGDETQLIFDNIKIGSYERTKRRNKLFYYNVIRRPYGFHNTQTDPISGIDHCGDCALAQKIIENYNSKYYLSDVTLQSINILLNISLHSFNSGNTHGTFLSIFHHIGEIYKRQGNMLLNVFMLYIFKHMYPYPIGINIEKRYQLKKTLNINTIISHLAKKYIVDDEHTDVNAFKFVLKRFLAYNSTWDNKNTIREYFYYDLTNGRRLTKSNANKLLKELDNLYKDIHDADYSNKSDIIIELLSDKVIVTYRDFTINISRDWYYINDMIIPDDPIYGVNNREVYLNAILYDSRISSGGFITIPDSIYNIINMIEYDNLYEISIGLHDMFFHDPTLIKPKITHFTHVDCNNINNVKPISDLKTTQPKTIIIGYYHTSPLFSQYLHVNMPADTLFIFIKLDVYTPDHKTTYNIMGYQIRVPYSAVNFMKEPVKYYTTHISFNLQGPSDVLYKIKNYHEQST
jgi:hypothetical protein